MTEPEFWKLIASSKKADPEEHVERLIAKLPVPEIVGFGHHWNALHGQAYTWKLWGAAYLMNGGCSDDGFADFRSWLTLQGEKTFKAALADPDSLAALTVEPDGASCECYPAPTAYELATGTKNPSDYYKALDDHGAPPPPGSPLGAPRDEDWDFDDAAEMAKRLPKLFAKFGGA